MTYSWVEQCPRRYIIGIADHVPWEILGAGSHVCLDRTCHGLQHVCSCMTPMNDERSLSPAICLRELGTTWLHGSSPVCRLTPALRRGQQRREHRSQCQKR